MKTLSEMKSGMQKPQDREFFEKTLKDDEIESLIDSVPKDSLIDIMQTIHIGNGITMKSVKMCIFPQKITKGKKWKQNPQLKKMRNTSKN